MISEVDGFISKHKFQFHTGVRVLWGISAFGYNCENLPLFVAVLSLTVTVAELHACKKAVLTGTVV